MSLLSKRISPKQNSKRQPRNLTNTSLNLEPGGHLQWTEIDISSLIEDMEPGSDRAKCEKLLEPLYDFIRVFGASKTPQKAVHNACGEAGFTNISSHASGLLQHPHLKKEFPNYYLETFSSMMPRMFEKLRQVPHSTATNMATQSTKILKAE